MRSNTSQPTFKELTFIPFDPKRVYHRKIAENKYFARNWVTVKVEEEEIKGVYCNVCLAFASSESAFTSGFTKYSHIYERLADHEASKSHNAAVTALVHAEAERDIGTLIDKEMMNQRQRQVTGHIEVLKRILAVIKFIGKQGIAYRAHHNEALHTLEDKTVNYGNFLEMISLLADFDAPLSNHLEKAMRESSKRQENLAKMGKTTSRGRGNLVTMLSKSTVNMILDCISMQIPSKIADEIGSQKFLLQMDGSTDTSTIDQATIIVRYVHKEEVKERLLAVREITGSKGEELFKLLESTIQAHGLQMRNVVGESFDGAANMRGEHKGVQKFIKDISPNSVYIWCYAHTLNLAATDIVDDIVPVKSLVGLLQSTAIFFSNSCKRMSVWRSMLSENRIGSEKLKRLQKIGETRWWSKQAALKRILGTFEDPLKGTYSTLIKVLHRSGGYRGQLGAVAPPSPS